jgi:hypothetical protein
MKRPLKGGRYTRHAKTGQLTKISTKTPPAETAKAANLPDDAATEIGKGKSK